MNLFYVSDEMLQMVANGKELNLPDEISINDIAEFSASKLIEARQRIRELEEAQSTLTEQLRLANEDAERLYVELEFAYDGEDVDTDTALRLHEERIAQESE